MIVKQLFSIISRKPKFPCALFQNITNNIHKVPQFHIQKRLVYEDHKEKKDEVSTKIGNREVVGFGVSGQAEYVDREDFPFPAIRYKPPYAEFQALREKERGDWRLLSKEEKKTLYRANFCQTFAEFTAPTGEWMAITGGSLILISVGIWLYILMKLFIYSQMDLPKSFTPVSQQLQLQRMLNMKVNPVQGLASRWDYEQKKWKSKPWNIPWDDPFDITLCEEDVDDD